MIRCHQLRLSGGGFGSALAALACAVGLVGLASSDRAFAANTLIVGPSSCTGATYTTIQSAVTAANVGDTIQVCAGTYPEQVVIPAGKTGVNLQSQSVGAATIQAPQSLPATQSSAIVEVHGATGITITGFAISGPAPAPGCGHIGYGVLIDGGASVTLTNNHITHIRDDPMTGCQNGWAIRAISATLTATGNKVDDYQKNGIDVRGTGAVGTITNNTVVAAGPTTVIAQNGIVFAPGASGTVTGNTVSGNAYRGSGYPTNLDVLGNGIVVAQPGGNVTISQNKLVGNDLGIDVFGVATGTLTASANAITGGEYGVIVDDSRNVRIEKNVTGGAAQNGLYAGKGANGNTFQGNIATGVALPGHDCRDDSSGSGTSGTANTWTKNVGDTVLPEGICASPPVDVNPPPVVVLPPTPGTGPPVPAGPPGQEVGNKIITKMRQKQLRSCVIEVRALGPSHALIASGVAHAPAKDTGRLIVRINVKPKGKVLLSKNFGGVIANVRALCRSTSGVRRHAVRRVRVVLLVEHRLTPPGSWVPDQPILTGIGLNFMHYLRHRIFAVRFIKCEGYTATWPPSPAFPPTLSLHRARRVCSELKRPGGAAKARVRLVPHGLTDPIATNSTESGRRVNRRVFVTIVHVFVFRS